MFPSKNNLLAWRPRHAGAWLLLAGMLVTLGFAPFNLWPVAVAGLAVLWASIAHARNMRQAMLAAMLWGAGWHLTALYWLPRAFYLDADRSMSAALLGGLPALAGLSLYGCLWLVALAAMVRAAPAAVRPVLFVAGWVGIEFLRSLSPLGFPWLVLGAMWSNWLPLAQAASVVGVYGLSAMLLAAAVLLVQGWRDVTERRIVWWGAAVVLLLANAGFGAWRLVQHPATQGDTLVRLVQPNVQDPMKWDPEQRWAYLEQTIDLTYSAGWTDVSFFVLPENAAPFYLKEEQGVVDAFTYPLRPDQAVVTGTVGREIDGETVQYFNQAAVLARSEMVDVASKKLLVPFGEYIPLRQWLDALPLPAPVRTLSQSRLDYTPATDVRPTAWQGTRFLPLICYEAIFAPYVAAHATQADWLLNITNDNWFTGTIALAQHAALARLRAVENGLPLVRAANTGISVVYDAVGREVARLPVNTAMVRDVRLPAKLEGTPWQKLHH